LTLKNILGRDAVHKPCTVTVNPAAIIAQAAPVHSVILHSALSVERHLSKNTLSSQCALSDRYQYDSDKSDRNNSQIVRIQQLCKNSDEA